MIALTRHELVIVAMVLLSHLGHHGAHDLFGREPEPRTWAMSTFNATRKVAA